MFAWLEENVREWAGRGPRSSERFFWSCRLLFIHFTKWRRQLQKNRSPGHRTACCVPLHCNNEREIYYSEILQYRTFAYQQRRNSYVFGWSELRQANDYFFARKRESFFFIYLFFLLFCSRVSAKKNGVFWGCFLVFFGVVFGVFLCFWGVFFCLFFAR